MHEDPDALLARLLHRIAPEVDLSQVDRTELLQDAAGLDSMDFLNLVAALFEETGIDVPERDYPAMSSIGGFVRVRECRGDPGIARRERSDRRCGGGRPERRHRRGDGRS